MVEASRKSFDSRKVLKMTLAVGPSLEFMYLFVTGAGKKNNSLLENPVDNSYSHNMDQSRQSW